MRCNSGKFVAHVKALPSAPYDDHTLATVLPEPEAHNGVNLIPILADAGYKLQGPQRPRQAPPEGHRQRTDSRHLRTSVDWKSTRRRRPAMSFLSDTLGRSQGRSTLSAMLRVAPSCTDKALASLAKSYSKLAVDAIFAFQFETRSEYAGVILRMDDGKRCG